MFHCFYVHVTQIKSLLIMSFAFSSAVSNGRSDSYITIPRDM